MAWPASIQRLDDALAGVDRTALALQARAISIRDSSLSGPISRYTVVNFLREVVNAVGVFDAASTLGAPLVAYARDQKNDQTIDVAAEFTAMRNAADGLATWINANFPTDAGSGAVLLQSMDASGNLSWDAPTGDWTIIRLGYASNYHITRPSPHLAVGLECDRLHPRGVEAHFEHRLKPIIEAAGEKAGSGSLLASGED